jgi:sulfur-carrier protein
MLRVKLFAQASQLAGAPLIEIPWTDGDTVHTLKSQIALSYPKLIPLMARLLVAINNDYAQDECPIRTNDEVACFPPVSGG